MVFNTPVRILGALIGLLAAFLLIPGRTAPRPTPPAVVTVTAPSCQTGPVITMPVCTGPRVRPPAPRGWAPSCPPGPVITMPVCTGPRPAPFDRMYGT